MATWVISDVHGDYDNFMKLLKNPEIGNRDTIILVGDIIDRGEKTPEMIRWAMKHVSENGKYQMVLGNHEAEVIQRWEEAHSPYRSLGRDISNDDIRQTIFCRWKFEYYMYNAGYHKMKDIKPIVEWFMSLSLYKNVKVKDKDGHIQKYIIAHAWYTNIHDREVLLWYRDVHWLHGRLDEYKPYDGEILIHGHTPVCKDNGYKKDWCADFRKTSINIDSGAGYREHGGRLCAIRLQDRHVIYV